jgi:hypothetical protein
MFQLTIDETESKMASMNESGGTGKGIEHPLHVLLQSDPKRGIEKVWALLEVSDYSLSKAARLIDCKRMALYRWLGEFGLMHEYEQRRATHASRIIDARIEEAAGEEDK